VDFMKLRREIIGGLDYLNIEKVEDAWPVRLSGGRAIILLIRCVAAIVIGSWAIGRRMAVRRGEITSGLLSFFA
jgi:hypothetical protein